MVIFNEGWYLVYTRPNHERKVVNFLNTLSIKSLLPTRKIVKIRNDRKLYAEELLFPSYVFLFLKTLKDYYGGLKDDGALFYVKTGSQLSKVPQSAIDNISLLVDRDDIEVTDQHFRAGEQLLIIEGGLTGLSCEVVEHKLKKKLLVRVELLRRNLLVTMTENYITRLTPAWPMEDTH
jgi:transcriptional antiterminator RfaH